MNKKVLSFALATIVTLGGIGGITVSANSGDNISVSNKENPLANSTKCAYSHTQDENKHTIVVSMGKCTNSGYSIKIDKIEFKEDTAIIYVIESYPKEDEEYLCVMTHPKDNVSFEKNGIIKFKVINQNNQELKLDSTNLHEIANE